jgi:Rrf2 family transcriptional regulator, iron-sulfur cluster assembly transcription factor
MFFSKTFGYALRGVLYVALACGEKQRIQVDEIARELGVPKHFLSKVMKNIVKHGIVNSTKGPYGGISVNNSTLSTPLFDLVTITNGISQFDNCVLRLKACNPDHPCPLHIKMAAYKAELLDFLMKTTIGDLLHAGQPDYIKSISTL